MNPIIKAQLSEFTAQNTGILSKETDYFEAFSIFSVLTGLYGHNIVPFRAHLKGEEFGLDGVAILVQGEICTDTDEVEAVQSIGKNHDIEFQFFQSKTSESLDYGSIAKFLDAVYDFFTTNSLVRSDQISDLLAAKDLILSRATKKSPALKCHYCCTGSGELSSEIENLISQNEEKLRLLSIFSDVSLQVYGAAPLRDGYRSATSSIESKINFPKVQTLPTHDKVNQAFIGYVSGDQLLKAAKAKDLIDGVREISRTIFFDNVRDFDPDSDINKSILAELNSGDLSSFVYKNNGVTIVAKKITRTNDDFTIEDYQIVNGCQTTNILARVSADVSKIHIPLRIIGSTDQDFVSSIIVGTNKQNKISDDQFWALLPFMKDLEEYCKAQPDEKVIYVERRDNQYRGLPIERTRLIRPSDLMKSVAAMYFFQPHRAARDHRGIRDEFKDRIFLPNQSLELYHLAALCFYRFDLMVRTGKVDRKHSLYKFYCIFSLTRKFSNKSSDILNSGEKKFKDMYNGVLDIVMDTEKFVTHINDVSLALDELSLDSATAKSREQVRDQIRSESFFEKFSSQYFSK